MIIKDDAIFRFAFCMKATEEFKEESAAFPFTEKEYSWKELKESKSFFYFFVQDVLKEQREAISLEAEKEAKKFILEEN